MATSSRLRGNINPIFKIKKGAAAAVDIGDDLKAVEITSDDGDEGDITFAEAAAGLTSAHSLNVTGITSFDANALYAFLWANPGVDVTVTYGPYGNAAASATKPHFECEVNTGRLPAFSTTAGTGKEGAEFSHEMELLKPPTLKTA